MGKLKKLAAQTYEPIRFTHFITIGEFYYEANQYDSAIVYLKPAFDNINDVELKCLAADFLHNIYQNSGDTLTASQYALYFTIHHEDDRVTNARTSTLNDMFQKHQQWEQQRLQTIEHQRFIKYITLLSILLILPILLILFPSQVSAQDTISKYLTLPEATVTAEKATCFYSKPSFTMFDFEILDDKFFILQKKSGLKSDYQVLVTDMLYGPIDTIILPQHIVPQNIILDCINNCQIVCQDSVYQIVKYENDYAIAFPCEKNRYQTVMGNILFVTSKYLYINELKLHGYISTFYRYDLETKKRDNLFLCNDVKSYREIKRDVRFHQYYKTVDPNYRGPNDEEWENFIRHAWYHTKDCRLLQVADTLYFFDHINNKIEAYDEAKNLLHSCEITYPDSPDYWRYTIYQDRYFGTFYTVLGTILHEINVQTGKTMPKIHINNSLSNKIIIYKGNLYSLKKKRDSSSSEISFIEKTNLN